MYVPNVYKNESLNEVKDFIKANGFGILLNSIKEKITGTHIPLELDCDHKGKDILIGHIAKANPQAKDLKNGDDVLVIFSGPHTYISSSWYEIEEVPTWNYMAVHVYGKIKIMKDDELFSTLTKLVDKYEKNSKNPVSLKRMSDQTLKQISAIVGFSIEINEIQAAYKLSQNRSIADYENIISELKQSCRFQSSAIAEEMKKRIKPE